MERDMQSLRWLRICLGLAGVAWGVSVFGVFMSWPQAEAALKGLGAQSLAPDPMLDYWLRMTAGAFTLIGCWFLVLMIWPRRFAAAIPWAGGFMFLEGVILLVHGLRLGLPAFPFYADVSACLVLGGAILLLAKAVRNERQV
jgi:hypothetical protein